MKSKEFIRGTLKTIILKLLSEKEKMYGYEISQRVAELSKDEIQLTYGALYPILYKLESEKLLTIINHDAERIERLITDYSQMLKDEASWSREQMSKVNLIEIINNVADDFKQDLKNQNKNILIKVKKKSVSTNGHYVLGIENRLEQVIANLLDNSISFSEENKKIEIEVEETSNNLVILIKDEGPGFSETSPQKIFKRFYSNRPKSFGKHSGLGLNIVKNIVELHEGTISASNRLNKGGAQVEVLLPKFS